MTVSPYSTRQTTSSGASPPAATSFSSMAPSTPTKKPLKKTFSGSSTASPERVNASSECVCPNLHEHVASAKPRLIQSKHILL